MALESLFDYEIFTQIPHVVVYEMYLLLKYMNIIEKIVCKKRPLPRFSFLQFWNLCCAFSVVTAVVTAFSVVFVVVAVVRKRVVQ